MQLPLYSLFRRGTTDFRVLGIIRSFRGTLLLGPTVPLHAFLHPSCSLPSSYTIPSSAMSPPSVSIPGPSTSAASDSLVQTLLDRIEGALLKKYSRTELLKSKKYRRSPSSFLSSSSSVRSIPIRHGKKDLIAPPRKRICRPSRFTLRFSCSWSSFAGHNCVKPVPDPARATPNLLALHGCAIKTNNCVLLV